MIVDLHLDGKSVIVIGGGKEALKRVRTLLLENCNVTIISPKVVSPLRRLINKHCLQYRCTKVTSVKDLFSYRPFLIIAATDNTSLNTKILQYAKKRNILAYSVSDPAQNDISHLSTFSFRRLVKIAISTKGNSPLMAKKIRENLEDALKKAITQKEINQIRIQMIARTEAKKTLNDDKARRRFLHLIMDDSIIKQLIKDYDLKKVQARIRVLLEGLT